ncbi:uncharacterized protein LOC106644360 [Copidosoma floridanum]|uniref:uncharacterized protein LOC106644360 n=1 Tax=Copidosoma floridanum TaxID=29053 RepID=UPI0006C980AE|nr:uncharacterized protein LOC106644360 [Copidosoma floridanum]
MNATSSSRLFSQLRIEPYIPVLQDPTTQYHKQRITKVTKEPSAPFDPERMLGYSRTDEDLPILDMENEVLQRTIKDYNAYMQSSSLARNKEQVQSPDRGQFIPEPSPSSSLRSMEPMAPPESEDELRGDLSCINGTFMPAPLVQHAVIKYVK